MYTILIYSLPSSVSGSMRPHGNHLGTSPLVVGDILSAIGLFGKSCYMQFAHCRIELNSKYPGASYVVLYSLYNSTVCVVTFIVLGTIVSAQVHAWYIPRLYLDLYAYMYQA